MFQSSRAAVSVGAVLVFHVSVEKLCSRFYWCLWWAVKVHVCVCVCVCVCFFPRGRYLVALGRSWHPEEFTCSQCKAVLDEGGFFEERGSVYCTNCHDNRYAPNCSKCKKKITGVRARGSPQTRKSVFLELRAFSPFKTPMPTHRKIRKCCNSFLSHLPGNHARPEDDLPCSVFQVCSLQDSHQEPSLLHGGGRTLLWER